MLRGGSLLRVRDPQGHGRVAYVELFFDLVFVFAVTQLSHALLEHLSLSGALQTLLLFMAVWWVWIYTTWITNWLDPERAPVRVTLLILMLAGLVLSASVPEAFADRGLSFALAYVFMQVGRSMFMLWALGDERPANTRNFQRITAWLVLSALFWISGALAEDSTRFALWATAIALEYLSPSVGFYVPGLGRSTTSDWDVEGGHMAERCALFIIVALGESILVTGATFAELDWTFANAAAFFVAFVGSVAMWWIYFDTGVHRGSERIAHSADPGRLARLAYTYIHLPIVAGIIVSAVADELVLAHPAGRLDAAGLAAIIGGPALFLTGTLLFERAIGDWLLSHVVGLGLLAGVATFGSALPPLAVATAAALILIVVAVWERVSLRRRSVAEARP